jgi:hypothetical protein
MASSKAERKDDWSPIIFFGRLAALAISFVILAGMAGVSYVFLATTATGNAGENVIYLRIMCSILFIFGFGWFLLAALAEGSLYFAYVGFFFRFLRGGGIHP